MWVSRILWSVLCGLLLSSPAWAYRTEEPTSIYKWDCPSFSRLNHYLHELWNITNGRYALDDLTSNPNGSRNGDRGEMVYATYSGDQYLCVNSSNPSPGTTWTCLNITTFGTLCGVTINGAVLFDKSGVCGEDEGFTFTPATNIVDVNEATDGNSILLTLRNDLSNTAGSTNETAQLRFGFGSASDNAAIIVGKGSDYTSGTAEDSFMDFYIDTDATLTRAMRIDDAQNVGIGTITQKNRLDVEGAVAVGSTYSGTSGAPTDGMIVEGKAGFGTAGTPGIFGNITAGNSSAQASIYIRGGTGVASPAQLFLTDNADNDVTSVAFTNDSSGTFPFTGKVLEFNFDTPLNGMFLFNTESNTSLNPIASEPHGIVVSTSDPTTGILTRSISLTSGTSFTNLRYNAFIAPTLIGVAGGAAEGCTNCATVYIDNAPISGANATLTNPYALWVDDGAVRFDGSVTYNSSVLLTAGEEVTGQIVTYGTSPTLSACGTTPTIKGNDNAGKITIGGGGAVTSCTATFAVTSVNAPACTLSGDNTAVTYQVTTTTSAMTIASSADMQSDVLSYICLRYLP